MVGRYHVDPETAILRVANWPREDRFLWQKALRNDDPFSEADTRANNREISNKKIERGYGRYLTYLGRHCPEALNCSVTERITPELVAAFIANMRAMGNRDTTAITRLQELHAIAVVLASKKSFSFIKDMEARIRVTARSAEQDGGRFVTTDELLTLGLQLIDKACEESTPRLRAIDFRDGLIIALLALRPMRRKNFAALKLDVNVIEVNGIWRLRLSPDETKTHNRIDVAWPDDLIGPLEIYLAVHRPVLMSIAGRWQKPIADALWVSSNGSPLTEMGFYQQVTKRTMEAFGRSINPHKFRHIAASTIALEDSIHVRVGASILGHSTFRTTEQYYIMAQSAQAHDLFVDRMMAKRNQTKNKPQNGFVENIRRCKRP